MNSDVVKIADIFRLIGKYKLQIGAITIVTLGFAISLSELMPKIYKSHFEINVYSKYFQNPLISEIVPGLYNIPEMRFTIDSMIKEAINDDYIDRLATEFKFYSMEEDEESVAKKRQYLRNQFKTYSTGGQSFKVSFEDSDAYRAKKISQMTLSRVKGHFINSRIETIETVKSIMLNRLQSLSASQKIGSSGTEKALASKSPKVLNAELNKIEASISALSKQYNMNHPKLIELKSRKKTIENWLKEFNEDLQNTGNVDIAMAMPVDKEINGALTGKFFTKYHDFNMALDIEKKSLESYLGVIERPQLPTEPIWPKKRLFAILGFLLGITFAFIYVFVQEVISPRKVDLVKQESNTLEIPFLGEFYPPDGANNSLGFEPKLPHIDSEILVK